MDFYCFTNKYLLLVSFLFIQIFSFGQNQSQITSMSKKICENYEKLLESGTLNKDNVESLLSEKILEVWMDELGKNSLEKIMKNQNKANQMTMSILAKTNEYCPQTLAKINNFDFDNDFANENSKKNPEEKVFSGYLERIEKNNYNFIVLNSNGKTFKFLWLKPFEGDQEIINADYIVKGKFAKIHYVDVDIFYPDINDYVTRKEVIKITY